MTIDHNYNSQEVLVFIDSEGAISTDAGGTYLFCSHETYSNVNICLVIFPCVIGKYCNVCNAIYNQNKMRKYDLALNKYWVTQYGYSRLATKVTLGAETTDRNILLYHGITEQICDKNF